MAKAWSYDEEILALTLYYQVPFGTIHAHNQKIVELAESLNRSPASVSMKMCNFARFDPVLRERGVAGLQNGSKLDEMVWDQFHANMDELVEASDAASKRLHINSVIDPEPAQTFPIGATVEATVKLRRNQTFFRNAVLSAYDQRCCITGISIKELLIASHIKPWAVSDSATERTNPQNGICLNALHDRAFDYGLITVTPEYRIVVSKYVRDLYSSEVISDWFRKYDGALISAPCRFPPSKEFLEYHNENIFKE